MNRPDDMNRKELTDYCCDRLTAIPCPTPRPEDYHRIYCDCMKLARRYGYSDRVFADIWYNARLWFEAVGSRVCTAAGRCA